MQFREYLTALERRIDPSSWPYLVALRARTFERSHFVASQVQFRHAVSFFFRPMVALAARLPPGAAREALRANINDELGDGDPASSHGATFAVLLEQLGVEVDALVPSDAKDPVREFNHMLLDTCTSAPVNRGLAALGMIERIFASVSAWIGAGIVRSGWLTADQVAHYATHQTLDLEHAESFFAPVEPHFPGDPEVRAGLDLGAESFRRLYAGLWADP